MSHTVTNTWSAAADTVREFENGTLPAERWYHGTHLTVAFWYLKSYPRPEAIERVREGIRRLNLALGGTNTADSGYHETLTLFWLGIVQEFAHRGGDPADALDELLLKYGERRDLWREYYSFDVVRSREARAHWVEPDLKG